MSLIKQYLHNLHNKMDPIDLFELKKNYVDLIIDGMDIDALCELAFDALSTAYDDYSEEQIVGEIKEFYGEETLNDLLPKTDISELEATANNYTTGK